MLGARWRRGQRVYTASVRALLNQAGSGRWMAIAATLVLAIGLAAWMRQTGLLRRSAKPLAGDAVIQQALRQTAPGATPATAPAPARDSIAPGPRVDPSLSLPPGHPTVGTHPVDSTAIKHRWLDEVRGVEIASLDPDQRALFVRFANARECTCGCGYTLAGCKASDMTCEVSGAALEALRDSIRTGKIVVARGIRERPRSAGKS